MKAIQVSFDEKLLEEMDADEEVRRSGRSAVMRRAVREYLGRRARERIARAYRSAYGGGKPTLDAEFPGWSEEGEWPRE